MLIEVRGQRVSRERHLISVTDSLPTTGIGEGLTAAYLSQANNTVIAAVRDPEHPTSKALHGLPRAQSSELIVVKIDSKSERDAKMAVRDLISIHNISAIDVIVANAGIANVLPTVAQAHVPDMLEHFMVNAVAPALLFQAFLPLLRKSQKDPKFVTLSTTAASIGDMEQVPIPNAAYGPSKAALNYLTKKIHLENPDIIAFPVSPG